MSRTQRYPLQRIRRHYTYSVDEVAALYGLAPATVLRWIRLEGLKRNPDARKFLVHGGDLADFLAKRNTKNKKPCGEGEIFCCKCRTPRRPKPSSLISGIEPNKAIRVRGMCSVCGTAQNKLVSHKTWTKTHPLRPNKTAPAKAHSGEHESPRECHLQPGDQLCLNITP